MQTWNKLAAGVMLVGTLTVPLFAGGDAKKTWTFDGDQTGAIAKGFTNETGEWKVVDSDSGKALAQTAKSDDAVFNVAHGALLTLGLARGDWDMLAQGLHDRLHEQRRAPLFPRSYELAQRARELGALGATISGAGPTVLVWCFYEQTGAVAEALAGEIDGWATLRRAPFEPQGAYVGDL